jgi:hypothetical protein
MPLHEVVSLPRRDSDDLRQRALERLYLRKAAVDQLIVSLQNYEKMKRPPAPCIPFSGARKCS